VTDAVLERKVQIIEMVTREKSELLAERLRAIGAVAQSVPKFSRDRP
jgi:hypothetical protein